MPLILPPTLITPGDRVGVAVSGGADSTALLLLVNAANTLPKRSLGIGLSVVHINHTLRADESDADQRFVEELCHRLDLPLHSHKVDTGAFATQHKLGIEEAARDLRYKFFADLFAQGKINTVLTAHTLDDQAETVLMKLLRGAWLEGLSAISPVLEVDGGRILRPLLRTRREELRSYLRDCGQAWREDSSNSDEAFTRNRIRHTVMPLLRRENSNVDQMFANIAELAREEESRWAAELKKILPQLILSGRPVRGGGRANSTLIGEQTLAIELDRLRALDPAVRRRVLRAAARQLGSRLTFDETSRLLLFSGFPPIGVAAAAPPAKSGSRLQLGKQLTVERSVRELRLTTSAPIEPLP